MEVVIVLYSSSIILNLVQMWLICKVIIILRQAFEI